MCQNRRDGTIPCAGGTGMRPFRLGLICLALCVGVSLASIVVETNKWWDIDAQTSWTAVVLAGWLVSLGYGVSLSRRPLRPVGVGAGAAIIMTCVAVPLLAGFGLKAAGVPVPWRAPVFVGGIVLSIVLTWLFLAVLILVGAGAARASTALWHAVRRPRDAASSDASVPSE